MYGWGSDTFTRPETQFPYDVPFAYFKGPSNAQLRVAIDYNGEGTGIVTCTVELPQNEHHALGNSHFIERWSLDCQLHV